LPAAFRFDVDKVFIRRDPATDDMILSRKPANWDEFLARLEKSAAPVGFLDPADRGQGVEDRNPLNAPPE
jgi:antitoxin VapB